MCVDLNVCKGHSSIDEDHSPIGIGRSNVGNAHSYLTNGCLNPDYQCMHMSVTNAYPGPILTQKRSSLTYTFLLSFEQDYLTPGKPAFNFFFPMQIKELTYKQFP